MLTTDLIKICVGRESYRGSRVYSSAEKLGGPPNFRAGESKDHGGTSLDFAALVAEAALSLCG